MLPKLKQDVRLTVDHPIALGDDRLPEGLSQVAFAQCRLDLEKVPCLAVTQPADMPLCCQATEQMRTV
jgi:hypothetical protein